MTLFLIILATVIVSLISALGIFLFFRAGMHKKIGGLISLAAGVLLAVAWLDIIPESLENGLTAEKLGLTVLLTILILFLVETTFHWHHCQHENCAEGKHRHLAWFNLFGDGLHNFVDGAVLASAFMVDTRLGFLTVVAVMIHEIPQELSDAGVLSYAGLSIKKIYLYNFLFALTAVMGAVLAYFFAGEWAITSYLLAVAAGNFIYLAMADLIPIIHHETDSKKIARQTTWFVLGIALIGLARVVIGE
ncbi:MAG TPA: ZIP family metal transporter [bacterium]|nr:ZIP family metal transporter [bacterium]